MKEIIKKTSYLCVLLVAVCILGFSIFSIIEAKKIGNSQGEELGKMAGTVIGTTKAALNAHNVYEERKQEDLSAIDTDAVIENTLKSLAKLEVLASSVSITDVNSVGENYKALYLLKGDAIFSVDLSKANINPPKEDKDGIMVISIEKPDVEVFINDAETEKLGEYQKNGWTGTSKDGYVQYFNSRKNIETKAIESIANYDRLMDAAIEAAEQQITYLVQSIKGNIKVKVVLK